MQKIPARYIFATGTTDISMKRLKTTLIALLATTAAIAQDISYGEYMERVFAGNIALTARKLDIEIADANIQASRIHNDPTIALTYTNNEDWDKKMGQGIELELSRSFTFGVRRSRIDLAERVRRHSIALLEEYMRNFRADATIAYLENLRAILMLNEAKAIYNELSEVTTNDSLRFIRGEIAESDWLESRMAQGIARNAVLEAEAGCNNSAITLGYYMGSVDGAESYRGTGSLEMNESPAPLSYYTDAALEHRADLVVALSNVEMAEATQEFNNATRRPDINVTVGATYNRARPDFTTLKAGIAIPLRFSNLNRGARIIDEVLVRQAGIEVEEAKLLIRADVMQAYNDFRYASMQSETFSESMLNDMNEVVESKKRAYEMGEISFLEYLIVERNKSEMRSEYIDALFGKAVAWVELQRATGFGLEFGTMPVAE